MLRQILVRNFGVSRLVVYSALFFLVLAGGAYSLASYNAVLTTNKDSGLQAEKNNKLAALTGRYSHSLNKFRQIQAQYPELDLKPEEQKLGQLKKTILAGNDVVAMLLATELETDLTKKDEEAAKDEALKGDVFGKVTDAAGPKSKVKVEVFSGELSIASTETKDDGTYSLRVAAGKYIFKVLLGGYQDFSKEFEVVAGQAGTLDIVLSKKIVVSVPRTVVPAPVVSDTADGNYQKKTVDTPVGSFTVNLMTFDLSQYEMRVDTAADGDCTNNCPVKNLKDYVAQNGAVAGIHGTYFCPTAYASCAGKTNSFDFKLYNTRLKQKINWSNGIWNNLPFLAINGSSAQYYSSWTSAQGAGMTAGISCRPKMVAGGEIIVTEADLDSDKERYSKISHGFIGQNGNTIYAGIAMGVTIMDEAQVIKALGIENAVNIDGGGTSAMYYNGAYKVGPGRDMPNAVVFVKR